MASCLVPGWGLISLSMHSDYPWEPSALPCCLGTRPRPSGCWLWAVPPDLPRLAPVQMTRSRPQMEFSVAAWPLRSRGNVPGSPPCWAGRAGSLGSPLSPHLPQDLCASHPPPHVVRLPPLWAPGRMCGTVHPGASVWQPEFWRKTETRLP